MRKSRAGRAIFYLYFYLLSYLLISLYNVFLHMSHWLALSVLQFQVTAIKEQTRVFKLC